MDITLKQVEGDDGDRLRRVLQQKVKAAACDRLVRGEDRGVRLDLRVWRRGNVVFWAVHLWCAVVKSCKRLAVHSARVCSCDKVSRAAKDLMRTVPERARVTK